MTDENPFIRFWRQGYTRLLPVVPPEAGIRDAGKRPGLKGVNGWYGTSVRLYDATEADCRAWHKMGAGVGLRCDGTFIALDIDTLSPQWVKVIRDLAFEHLGPAPIRIGRDPKELLLYLTDGAIDYQQMRFDDGVEDKKTGLVEMLTGAEGTKWFVMHGIHPVTKRPYRWPAGTPGAATLSRVTAEQVRTFFEALASVLPAAKGAGTVSADRAAIDQAKLKGDVEMIKRAIETIPNDPGRIGYQEWMTMAAALRGACQDDYALGLELFQDWSEKADLDTQTENPARVYGSIQPPFSLGADYLFSKAAAEDPAFVAARYWEPVEDTPLFPDDPADSAPNAFSIHATPLREFDPAMLPRRQWLYGDHYIRKYVSTTSAPSAVGKSSMVLVEALAMVTGKPLLGIQPKGVFRVWYWNGEDPIEEMELRLAAAMKHYGLAHSDLGGRFFLNSGREMPIVLAKSGRDGAVIHVPVVDAVMATMRANAIDVGVLDPFVSTYAGAETNEMLDPVVKKWGAIAGATNASIELVHHTRKLNGTEASVEDTRGGGALIAGARSKRVLARMTKPEAKKFGIAEESHRRFFRVADASVNMALPAIRETAWLEMHSVSVGNGEGDTPVEREMSGDSVGVAAFRSLQDAERPVDDDQHAAILAALASGEWRENARSNAWAGHAVATVLRVDASEEKSRIEEILRDMKRRGDVYVERRTDKNGNKVPFIVVTAADVLSVNLFD